MINLTYKSIKITGSKTTIKYCVTSEKKGNKNTDNFPINELLENILDSAKNDGIEITKIRKSRRSDNIFRTKNNVQSLAMTNMTKFTKFITLSYNSPCGDLPLTKKDLRNFILNLRKNGFSAHYLAVPEVQELRLINRNEFTWHWHLLFFSDCFIPLKVLNNCWNKGYTDIKAVSSENLAKYLVKYITKNSLDNIIGQFCITSKGIKKPVIKTDKIFHDLSRQAFNQSLYKFIQYDICTDYDSNIIIPKSDDDYDNVTGFLCSVYTCVVDTKEFFKNGGFNSLYIIDNYREPFKFDKVS